MEQQLRWATGDDFADSQPAVAQQHGPRVRLGAAAIEYGDAESKESSHWRYKCLGGGHLGPAGTAIAEPAVGHDRLGGWQPASPSKCNCHHPARQSTDRAVAQCNNDG